MFIPAPAGPAARRSLDGGDPGEAPRGASAPALSLLALLAALLVVPTGANAQQEDAPSLSFDAFGTLGLVYSTEDRADFVANPLRPEGPGHSESVSPDIDSRLGGQVMAFLTPQLTAVLQVVAEQDHEDEYTPGVEWAYAQYALTPEFTVRAGRTPLASFLVSDFRKVSYANPWMRPPVEVYGLSPVTSLDGMEVSYRTQLGEWTSTARASFGRGEDDFPDGTAEAENILSVDNTLQRGGFTGRARFARGEVNIDAFDSLFDGFRQFGPEGEAIADRYEVDDTPFQFLSLAAEYDPGPWFGMVELGWVDFNSVLGEKLAGYTTFGYRLGTITPYGTYSRVGALSETSTDGLSVENLPPEAAQVAAGLNAELDELLVLTPVQQSLALGARWDVAAGMALKLQVDFIDLLEGSPGTFINEQPGFERGGSARVVSLATVFVF